MKRILLYFALLTAIAATGCREKETIDPNATIPGLGGQTYPRTDFDDWLDATFLYPYNINVVYHWDAAQIYDRLGYSIVPCKPQKAYQMMRALADVWFKPFLEDKDVQNGFLQRYAPKTIVLAGSMQYESGGGAVLGTAEGATKVFLTGINNFNFNRNDLTAYMHVIEHEFTHVLNQAVSYGTDFKALTAAYYDPTGYVNYAPASGSSIDPKNPQPDAWRRGFLSAYSMSAVDEDFAEIVSLLMVNGWAWFENEVLPEARKAYTEPGENDNPNAEQALLAKATIAADYLKTNFGITLFDEVDETTGITTKTGISTAISNAIDYVVNHPEEYKNN